LRSRNRTRLAPDRAAGANGATEAARDGRPPTRAGSAGRPHLPPKFAHGAVAWPQRHPRRQGPTARDTRARKRPRSAAEGQSGSGRRHAEGSVAGGPSRRAGAPTPPANPEFPEAIGQSHAQPSGVPADNPQQEAPPRSGKPSLAGPGKAAMDAPQSAGRRAHPAKRGAPPAERQRGGGHQPGAPKQGSRSPQPAGQWSEAHHSRSNRGKARTDKQARSRGARGRATRAHPPRPAGRPVVGNGRTGPAKRPVGRMPNRGPGRSATAARGAASRRRKVGGLRRRVTVRGPVVGPGSARGPQRSTAAQEAKSKEGATSATPGEPKSARQLTHAACPPERKAEGHRSHGPVTQRNTRAGTSGQNRVYARLRGPAPPTCRAHRPGRARRTLTTI